MLGGFPCEASFLGRPRLILIGQMLHMYCSVYRYLIMLWHFYVRTRCPRSDSPGSSPTTFGLSDESGTCRSESYRVDTRDGMGKYLLVI